MKGHRQKRLAGVLRVSLFFAVLGVLSLGAWTRHAKAEAGHEGLRFGRELAPLADLFRGQHQIALNGEEIFVSQATTEQPVSQVLDRVADHCRKNPGALQDLWNDVARADRLSEAETSSLLSDLAMVRDEEDGEGVVLCFAKNGDGKAVDALRRFAETMDLGALGKLRYVYARPDGAGRTHVMSVWTEGSFRVDRLLSEAEGRVPEDLREVPRPLDSRFLFDGRIRGTKYGIRVYRTSRSVADVADFYDRTMADRGWDIVKPKVPGGETRGYSKEGVHMVMGALVDERGGGTLVSLSEIGATPPTHVELP